jgi:hypothetical protein
MWYNNIKKGIDALKKASSVAEGIINKSRSIIFFYLKIGLLKLMKLEDFDDINVDFLGSETTYGEKAKLLNSREIVLRFTLTHQNVYFFYN